VTPKTITAKVHHATRKVLSWMSLWLVMEGLLR